MRILIDTNVLIDFCWGVCRILRMQIKLSKNVLIRKYRMLGN